MRVLRHSRTIREAPDRPGTVAEVGRLDHFQYLLLMAGCLLITLPLEFVLRCSGLPARGWRWRSRCCPVVIIFSIWDIVGILRDHWTYSPRFTTG